MSVIFEPLHLGSLTIKNRIVRSSVGGRFDNYDGSGTDVRINFEAKFARGGVGAIISSHAPIYERGHIFPGYAYLDSDDRIPYWREVGRVRTEALERVVVEVRQEALQKQRVGRARVRH